MGYILASSLKKGKGEGRGRRRKEKAMSRKIGKNKLRN